MTTVTIQVRGRGTLTLPSSLREKYRLGEGDPLTVVDLDGAVLLSPRVLLVPRLAAEMERLRRARKPSLKDLGGPAPGDRAVTPLRRCRRPARPTAAPHT